MSARPSLQSVLGPAAAPVYDREAMLREVLAAKLFEWLDGKVFYVNALRTMRAIARDIQGLPETDPLEPLPTDIDRLHCMGFDTLSALSLFESVAASIEYVGVTEATGADLLGAEQWAQLQRRVSALKEAPSAEGSSVATWAQLTLANLAGDVFGGNFFSVCDVDKLAPALSAIRRASGLAPHARNETTYAALNALHCKHWRDMDPAIGAGLKDAVWEVCGLDEQVGPLAFGEHWERIRSLSAPTPVPGIRSQASDTISTPEAGVSNVESGAPEVNLVGRPTGARSGWPGRFMRNLLGRG